jgi:hypothetical protein
MAFFRPGLLLALISCFFATGLTAQSPANNDIFTISVAAPTSAKDIQVRYFFTGEFGGRGSSEVFPVEGNKLVIKTGVEGKSAKGIKLIAYAPGCQLVTLTVDDLKDSDRQGEFQCQKLATLQLRGRLDVLDLSVQNYVRVEAPNLQVEALYVCRWAMPFFGIANGATSPFSVGKAALASDGTFTIEVPDFTADPSWPRLSGDAVLTFVLAAKTGEHLAPLTSLADSSRDGVVPVASSYPELTFAVQGHGHP